MKLSNTVTIFSAAILLVLSCLVKASPVGTVDIAYSGLGASDVLTIWGGGHNGLNGYGGVYMLNKTAGTGQGNFWPNGLIGSFCMELNQLAASDTRKYDVFNLGEANVSFFGSQLGTAKANYITELWGRFYDPAWATTGSHTNQQNRDAEAFSAAVWEIIYEDLPGSPWGWNVSVDGTTGTGGFKATNVDATTANSWLHALNGLGPKAELRAFINCGKQDYIVEVPEPATLCLLGLSGLVFLRKRK
jgi:hypothetical protein